MIVVHQEESGWTDLHYAVNNLDAGEVLSQLSRGLDPNAVDALGVTPLALAIDGETDALVRGAEPITGEVVELLLRAGADPDAIAWDGKTARQLAMELHHNVALALFDKYAGNARPPAD